jgi:hypothetical protein
MKMPILFLFGLAGCTAFGWGQTKFTATGKCEPPASPPSIEVGDRAGHSLTLAKESCTWTTPVEMEGLKSTGYVVTATSDVSGTKGQDNGYVVITMDNGDKAFVRFHGSSTPATMNAEGTWNYTGGTGKLKGLIGKGTYKTVNGVDEISGDYSIGAPKGKK